MSTLPESATPQPDSATSRNQGEPPTSNAVITPITQQDSSKTHGVLLGPPPYVVFNDLGYAPHSLRVGAARS